MNTWLADDFEISVDDFGEAIEIRHITSEAINTQTGTKTKYETVYNVPGITRMVSQKDLILYPSSIKFSDTSILVKAADVLAEKGDSVIISGETYIIVEKKIMYGIIKLFCRKS